MSHVPPTISFAHPRFGIRRKLLSGYVVIALFTAMLGLYAVASLEQLNHGQHLTSRDVFGGTHLLAMWIDRASSSRRAILTYALSEDPAERAPLRAQMATDTVELERITQQIDAADIDRAEVAALARVMRTWHEYERWRDQALSDADAAADPGLIFAEYRANGAQLDSAIDLAIDEFLASKRSAGDQLEQSAQVTYEQTRQLAMILSAGAVALALAIGLWMSRHIARATAQVAAAAEGLARGDLDQRIEVHSGDELGQMAESFRRMILYQQDVACVANAIARGDLSQDIEPKSEADVLGNAIRRMSENLRRLVAELQDALQRSCELVKEKDSYGATIREQLSELSRLLNENAMLHDRVRHAAVRTAALNEQSLRRIGADLHDGPGQALALALLRLDTPDTAHAHFNALRRAVTDALADIRSIAAGLRIPELEQRSLLEVVTRAVREHERRSGTPVHLDIGELSAHSAFAVKLALFRALQEALSNATRHGGGREVTVRTWVADDWLWLTVADRGQGFRTSVPDAKGRLGLVSMRERAELLGGRFHVDSAPGRGTIVQLCWPLSLSSCEAIDDAISA
jgi:signal transduction histidine kinase